MIDTQVVLDWLVFCDPRAAALARAVESGAVRWIATAAMRAELDAVLDRGVGAARRPDRAAIATSLARFAHPAEPAPPPAPVLYCSDPDDQIFIDLALAAGARWLFSRDRALLRLAKHARPRGLAILEPADWQPESAPPR